MASIVLVTAIVGVTGLSLLLGGSAFPQVPPPNELPAGEIPPTEIGDVVLFAEAEYWQDFMPSNNPNHPFYVRILVNITNNGDSTIDYLSALRTTIYFNGTFNALVTLNLTQAYLTFVPITVRPGESVVIEYINDDATIFSPSITEGTVLYSRVLFVWGAGNEAILTTSPNELNFTF